MGKKHKHPMGYFSQTFLLFRGAFMNPKWIENWRAQIGKTDKFNKEQPHSIYLPENISFTKNYDNALHFAQTQIQMEDRVPVMFFVCVRNWSGFNGFRLNRAQYSAHYHEDEVLLFEGFKVYVLSIEEVFCSQLNRNITVIRLYNH